MAGFQIPVETRINFLEFIVIPSFVVSHPSQTREDWMRSTAGDVYGDQLENLILSVNFIQSCDGAMAERAEQRAERAEQRAERAEQARREERAEQARREDRALQQQLAGPNTFFLSFFLLTFHF
jgi:ribosomal protein L12E/L44/L45/RPP1/RPP2